MKTKILNVSGGGIGNGQSSSDMICITNGLHLYLVNGAFDFAMFVLLGEMVLDPLWCASNSTTLANEDVKLLVDHKA